jgi:signal transduction histidine kinase
VTQRDDGWRRWAVDAGLAVVAVVPALVDQATTDTSAAAWWALSGYCVVVVAGLAVRRRFPVAAYAAILLTLAVAEIATATADIPISTLAVLGLAFALYAVGAYSPLPTSIAAVAGGAAVVAVGIWVNHATAPPDARGGSDVLATVAPLPVAWALGLATHSYRTLLSAAEQRADDALREQRLRAQQAAQTERVRIARDMHDVVAHSLTLLVVHAETLRARGTDLPDWARPQIDGLAAAGRQATTELRDLLRVLRDPVGDAAPRAPAPTLADLPELAAASRAAGNPVTVTTSGDLATLPRPVQLAGYRVIQEALANARRHAPGAAITVTTAIQSGLVRFVVTNGRPPRASTPNPGTGLGIGTMTERVAALGGQLHSGSMAGGGFQVYATIPLEAADE